MQDAGSGLGSAGFIVFDDSRSPLDVAAGASARFLSVESCGQCEPCKAEGLAITWSPSVLGGRGDSVRQGGSEQILARLRALASRVTDGARCNLAFQQQEVVASLLALQCPALAPAPTGDGGGVPLVAPITDIVDGRARLEQDQADKQPDWTVGGADSEQLSRREARGHPRGGAV
ncbi:MAG: NADH-ubiquinone oxidoreductase-F iron-sulfur binding region domain-containing protein [Microthrixaceae bacterium]